MPLLNSLFSKLKPFVNLRNELKVTLVVLLIVSTAAIFFVIKTMQDQDLINKSLAEKEILIASLSASTKNLLSERESLKSEDNRKQLETINQTIEKYETLKEKTASYKSQGVDVTAVEGELPKSVDLILQKKYSEADSLLTKLDADLEIKLKEKQAADAAAASAKTKSSSPATSTCSSIPSNGYCKTTVNGFTVDVITAPVSSVWTDTGNTSNCSNGCNAKNLLSYVQGNGGYAGMNGSYFCPPDYSTCASSTYSYTYSFYNSPHSVWINADKFWYDTAIMTFSGNSVTFYPHGNSYGGGNPRAGVGNFPGLVYNGANIVNQYSLTSAQYVKSTRGGIGVKGSTVYLVIARSASVPDLGNIMIALGMTHALNLDGGGSSAMVYNGAYKVGPGRLLPNAVILK